MPRSSRGSEVFPTYRTVKVDDDELEYTKIQQQDLCCDYTKVDSQCPEKEGSNKRHYNNRVIFSKKYGNLTISITGHGMKHVPLLVDTLCDEPTILLSTINHLITENQILFGSMQDTDLKIQLFDFVKNKNMRDGRWGLYLSKGGLKGLKLKSNFTDIHSFLFGYDYEGGIKIWTIYPIKFIKRDESDPDKYLCQKIYNSSSEATVNDTPRGDAIKKSSVEMDGESYGSPTASFQEATSEEKTRVLTNVGFTLDLRLNCNKNVILGGTGDLRHPIFFEHNDTTYFSFAELTEKRHSLSSDLSNKNAMIMPSIKLKSIAIYSSTFINGEPENTLLVEPTDEFKAFYEAFLTTNRATPVNDIKSYIEEHITNEFEVPQKTPCEIAADRMLIGKKKIIDKLVSNKSGGKKCKGKKTRKFKK